MTEQPAAAIYCRISRDPEGLRVGVERQEEDCRALAEREGYRVAQVYVDNDISASTLSRKTRPQYDEMLAAVRRGEVSAIIGYSNSRLTRRPLELEELIKLHTATGVRIVTVVSGEDDLSTADGTMIARIKASIDAGEAHRTSERLKRAFLQRARTGISSQGGRVFGWAADKQTLDPVESLLIRQAVEDLLAGVPLRAIARDWNERGVKTSRGTAWTHTTLRRLLKRERLAGWRTHKGELVRDSAGQPVRGAWEPLLDQDTFDRLQVTLTRDGRGGVRRGARRYLLTGTARCATCGKRMFGRLTTTGTAYFCADEPSDHTVTITAPQTEWYVIEVVKGVLGRENLEAPAPAEFEGSGRLAQIPGMIADLMRAFNAGQLSSSVAFGQVQELEAEQAELKVRRSQYIAEITTRPSTVAPDDLEKLDVDRQRAVLESVLDAVVIAPAGRRGEPWTPDRVTFAWKAQPVHA